ncbi:hydroxylamine oxidoreductase precursor [bacterium BMS3Abin07]|nr:hydroxylamine oxidoreductase precursor [bacterium BMS3Abin07]GBE33429.1 hydroxylamine oxidoreductase precursor [bacterium BMS3Bbin05]HDL21049.1 hydroxylamine oxidase [Nitrospirota bacterium]HDO21255.1 hydroxylamine oxidase [Nitrospirota bacterium]HDZ87846.1 hydroxylamine oxidase [Nitrospirota bacterium]
MKKERLSLLISLTLVLFLFTAVSYAAKRPPFSPQTEACLGCHKLYTPGIVKDWLTSRHAKITPALALKQPELMRRISAESVPRKFSGFAVGCYECHSQHPDKHRDNFEHMGFRINVIVSPNDCRTCHPVEVKQYAGSKKAHAIENIMDNPVYHTLVSDITGLKEIENGRIKLKKPSYYTLQETCLGCHGTKVEVKGMKTVSTPIGDISVPNLTHWTNQGVGRENPDGSFGACTACHPRHGFSIEVARKPYTCAQCHLDPDVPAWNVYKESKHGNLFFSKGYEWNFSAVPWTVGKDFTAPTCAACHNSLLVSPDGQVIAQRTHDFGARLWVRLFGLIYAVPQPKSGNTTIIRNKDGLPLPATFLNEPASGYLIDKAEQKKRYNVMTGICKGCHSTDWVNDHFAKLDNTIKETNEMTLAATKLMIDAWDRGIEDRSNPFDENIEMMWVKQWLFYSNAVRYASAMTGAPDYTAFKLGWWGLTHNLQQMKDMIEIKSRLKEK